MTRRGFSVIEILLALAVLSVAVLALLGILPVAIRQQRSSTMTTQALHLAVQTMDDLLQRNERISTTPQSDQPFAEPIGTRSWWGAPDPDGRPGLQLVTVEVVWAERAAQHRVRLQSLLAP